MSEKVKQNGLRGKTSLKNLQLVEAHASIANLLQVPTSGLGLARAVENAGACVAASARAYPELARVQQWGETFSDLSQVAQKQEATFPELGALPVQTDTPSVHEILCQPMVSVLADPQTERVLAWFGIQLLVALTAKHPLNRLLCHQFKVLLNAGKGSTRNKDDWYRLSEWMPLTESEILEAKRECESDQVKKLLDATLVAIKSKTLAPVAPAVTEPGGLR